MNLDPSSTIFMANTMQVDAAPLHSVGLNANLVDAHHNHSVSQENLLSCGKASHSPCTLTVAPSSHLSHPSVQTRTPHPDLYQDTHSSLGPRPILSPISLEKCTFPISEIAKVFDEAVMFHSRARILEAAQLYEVVSHSAQNLLQQSFVSSDTLLQLGMNSYNNYASIAFARGDFAGATIALEVAMLFAQRLVDSSAESAEDYVVVLSNWCHVGWKRGDVTPALFHGLREVLRLRSEMLNWDNEDVAAAHYNLAVAEYANNATATALQHFLQYLKIARHRSKAGKTDLDQIPALTYALILQNEDQGDCSSKDLVRGLRALQHKRHEFGLVSAEVASALNFVGTLLFHKNDLDNALLFFQEELRLEEDLVECQNDISVSVTCNNIGRILQELGNLKEAVLYYKRALHAEGSIDENDQSTSNLYSTVWYNLGLIHDKLGDYSDAIEAFSKSLELRKALLGLDHPDIACLYYNIGVLQMEQQHLDKASRSFAEALRIRYHGAGNQLNDDRVIKTLKKLASLYKAKGNIRGATQASREILKILDSSTEVNSWTRVRDSALLLRSIAELHHAEGDMKAAMDAAQMSVDKFGNLMAIPDVNQMKESAMYNILEQLGSSLVLLGSLFHEMSDPIQADHVLNQSVEMLSGAISACQQNAHNIPSSIFILREVASMLANNHCAPEA